VFDRRHSGDDAGEVFGIAVLALVGVTPILYVPPLIACLAQSQRFPPYAATAVGTLQLPAHMSDPLRAYPRAIDALMPDARHWWLIVGGGLALVAFVLGSVLLRVAVAVDRARGRRHLDLGWWDLRRLVTPRPWARPCDLMHLQARDAPAGTSVQARAAHTLARISHRRSGSAEEDGWTLGWLHGRQIRSSPECHPLLAGPTRSGKSREFVRPWLLEHAGPAVVTSLKPDVLLATYAERAALGPVRVYAPLTDTSALPVRACGWTPRLGCERWEYALSCGRWLADSGRAGGGRGEMSEGARFYNRHAAGLLGGLLHAAALGDRTMEDVVRWLSDDERDRDEPVEILEDRGARAAATLVNGAWALDQRPRSLVLMSALQLVDAYRFPSVAVADRPDFDPAALLRGGTLYIVAPESQDGLLAPVIAAMLGAIFRAAEQHANAQGPLRPTLRMILDEAAQLAALDSLPRLLAVSAGWGVRIASVWQDLSQLRDRYGDRAGSVLGSSLVKLALGPIQDEFTRRYFSDLLDDHPSRYRTETKQGWLSSGRSVSFSEQRKPKAGAQQLMQLRRGEVLMIHGSDLPAILSLSRRRARR
jgi:type IV secretion system protein VirD4